jgi:exosortase D (VPLPA-CTERM-specific)
MNSVRIAIAGVGTDIYGVGFVEGFSHFFEGWVIFIICVLILFGLARLMLFLHPSRMSLGEALDLDTDGLVPQAARLKYIRASGAMVTGAFLMVGASAAFLVMPERDQIPIQRASFADFPRQLGDWTQVGPAETLSASVARTLAATDYRSVTFTRPGAVAPVEFFSAWYADQSKGGVHSPEICLPGGGWEIAWLERTDVAKDLNWPTPFRINRAIIQKGGQRMMVYYWFDQKGRKIAWDFAAKFWLMVDGIRTGRTDGALVRLTTPILPGETDAQANARLMDMLHKTMGVLPRYVPGA